MRHLRPTRRGPSALSAAVLAGAGLLPAATVAADTFVLKSGGTLEGRLLNPDERPRTVWRIALETGGELVLASRNVTDWTPARKYQTDYKSILPKMPPTAEGNLIMARWCRERGLTSNAEFHFERVLSFDPESEEARKALGYVILDGKWVRPDERMKSMGYVRYKGSWRLPMDIALEEGTDGGEVLVKDWQKKIKTWVKNLGTARHEESVQAIRAVSDPAAGPGLAAVLKEETRADVRIALVEALGRTGGGTAALTDLAITDPSGEVRDAATRVLTTRTHPNIVAKFVHDLASDDNAKVNNAALALARLQATSAIPDLIDALTTKHTIVVGGSGGQSAGGAMPMSVGTGGGPGMGGIGMSQGGGPKAITQQVQNGRVFDALMVLTGRAGATFGYNKDAWRAWYTAQKTPAHVDLLHRRD